MAGTVLVVDDDVATAEMIHLDAYRICTRYHPTKPWKRMPYGTDGSRAAC